jgi:PKD repeat protein
MKSHTARLPSTICPFDRRERYPRDLAFITSFLFLLIASFGSFAGELTLAWNSVEDDRVVGYELHYGEASGQYQASIQATEPTTKVTALDAGKTYYFAVKAIGADRSIDSPFSEEVSATIAYATPQASFTLSGSSGVAPFGVTFEDTSTGAVEEWAWSFGDGTTATTRSPGHVYQQPGDYLVSLLVRGPGGWSAEAATARVTVAVPPPVAGFTADATSGVAPMLVVFNDASTGDVATYEWSFGDGGTSTGSTAAWTYPAPGTYSVSLKVTGAGGSDSITKTNLISVSGLPPVAEFDASNRTGDAPLSVVFQDLSSGDVTQYLWDFGDGQTSTERSPTHVYTEAGTYDVSLSVTGPWGSHTSVKSAFVDAKDPGLPIEVGEVVIDHNWQWVEFGREFNDPVVVANPPSFNDAAPATVRISGVEATGFWIRIQEWDYLDGIHGFETVNYIAIERGSHTLKNGARVEAGTFIQGGSTFYTIGFGEAFTKAPVVLTSVTSTNDAKAVTTRLRNVKIDSFQIQIQEQESIKTGHGAETISYIAWPPSEGTIDELRYRVGLTGKNVSDRPFVLKFGTGFSQTPAFLAHLQSTNGGEPGTLRYRDRTATQVVVWVEEERSKDKEISHVAETVGWIIFE